ncbi:MAG: sulfatase-like hydrolase/transferase [Ignavibacteriaceae bacterium]
MQRRKFIKSLGLGISTAPFIFNNIIAGRKTKNDTQNFLFIVIEDITTNFGCYDKPYILTPQNSVQFNNAYCQEPVCAASRASFLTGLRPETVGVE